MFASFSQSFSGGVDPAVVPATCRSMVGVSLPASPPSPGGELVDQDESFVFECLHGLVQIQGGVYDGSGTIEI